MGPSSPVSPSSNSTPTLPGTGNPVVSAAASAGTGTASSNLSGGFLGNSPYGTGNTSLLSNASGYHTNTSPRPPSANGIGGSLGGQMHPAMSTATPSSIGNTYSHMHSMSHFNPSAGFSSQYSNMAGSTAADIASPHYHDMRGSAAATGWYTSPHTDPRFASEYCKYLDQTLICSIPSSSSFVTVVTKICLKLGLVSISHIIHNLKFILHYRSRLICTIFYIVV